jgi:hypothetical protein
MQVQVKVQVQVQVHVAEDPGDGGPYWMPPGESSGYGLAADGYYTNDSRQQEDWIEIHVEATDQHPVTSVKLYWLAALSPTARPTTYGPFNFQWNAGLNCWVINTDTVGNFPPPQEGTYYSFNVVATDQGLSSATKEWRKTGPQATTPRRWVQLDCQPVSISYKPYYFGLGSYTMNLNGERGKKDRFHHDSGPDDGNYDVGALMIKPPTSIEQRCCTSYIGYWFDASVCVSSVTIPNIYYHIRFSRANPYSVPTFGWARTREHLALGSSVIDQEIMSTEERSTYFYYDGSGTTNDTYGLCTGSIEDLDTSEIYSDNSIYEMFVFVHAPIMFPAAISSRSTPSFVIFNVPDPAVLATMDSDLDGLSDEQELYGINMDPETATFTSPFLADTDNDQYSDYIEHQLGSDPNDPGSTPTEPVAPLAMTHTPGLQLRMEKPMLAGTAVSFSLPVKGPANLSVFDIQGRVVRTLLQGPCDAGDHAVSWDGKDSKGQPMSAGLYFFTLNAAGQRETRKIILTR